MKPANAAIRSTLGAALVAAFAFLAPLSAAPAAQAGERPFLHVISSASGPLHGCCLAWAEKMRANGFRVLLEQRPPDVLNALKIAAGLTPATAACHTAMVEGYVVEGHVAPGDVHRLLSKRPDAAGLSVPGMPAGAPGMPPGGGAGAYETLLIGHDGAVRPWAVHIGR